MHYWDGCNTRVSLYLVGQNDEIIASLEPDDYDWDYEHSEAFCELGVQWDHFQNLTDIAQLLIILEEGLYSSYSYFEGRGRIEFYNKNRELIKEFFEYDDNNSNLRLYDINTNEEIDELGDKCPEIYKDLMRTMIKHEGRSSFSSVVLSFCRDSWIDRAFQMFRKDTLAIVSDLSDIKKIRVTTFMHAMGSDAEYEWSKLKFPENTKYGSGWWDDLLYRNTTEYDLESGQLYEAAITNWSKEEQEPDPDAVWHEGFGS